jgi:hypothetical protein
VVAVSFVPGASSPRTPLARFGHGIKTNGRYPLRLVQPAAERPS